MGQGIPNPWQDLARLTEHEGSPYILVCVPRSAKKEPVMGTHFHIGLFGCDSHEGLLASCSLGTPFSSQTTSLAGPSEVLLFPEGLQVDLFYPCLFKKVFFIFCQFYCGAMILLYFSSFYV